MIFFKLRARLMCDEPDCHFEFECFLPDETPRVAASKEVIRQALRSDWAQLRAPAAGMGMVCPTCRTEKALRALSPPCDPNKLGTAKQKD